MFYQEILPRLELCPFIKNYLLVHFEHVPVMFSVKPYPTRVEQALNFFVRGHIYSENLLTGQINPIKPNALFGQQTHRLNLQTVGHPEFLMLMVVFRAGAMYRLLGIPNQELTTEFCDAEAIFSPELQVVNDQIANARTYTEMIERAEEYLLRKVRNAKHEASRIDQIGELLINNPNKFSLDWIADQACLSPRQFERKFSERMGISPKLYSRIGRFYQAFQYKEINPKTDWLTIALHYGYTDYYHLVKDFKQFAGDTPNSLLKAQAQGPERILGLE